MLVKKQSFSLKKCLSEWNASLAILLSILIIISLLIFEFLLIDFDNLTVLNIILLLTYPVLLYLNFSAFIMTWRDYVAPINQLMSLTQAMLAGNLDSEMEAPKKSRFIPLSNNINALAKMLMIQSNKTEHQINEHLKHITEKNNSLEILYKVAASMTSSNDVELLLVSYLTTLKNLIKAEAGLLQIQQSNNQLKVIDSFGFLSSNELINLHTCLYENHQQMKNIIYINNINEKILNAYPDFNLKEKSYGLICLPLRYENNFLGSYNLIIDINDTLYRPEVDELLTSICQHLSVALNQDKLKKESEILHRVEERSSIADELHDSLAQTIASIRFQARVLDDSLHQENDKSIWQEMERLENSIDEANVELRELIAHFKAPVQEQDLVSAIEQTILVFKQTTGNTIFFQKEFPETRLPAEMELQILRIIQESLANIRKHAEAKTVRIMLKGSDSGCYNILIEDDGIGFNKKEDVNNNDGEHIGLSVMKDRAKRINGNLKIESEKGEGTRVMLNFSYTPSNLEIN